MNTILPGIYNGHYYSVSTVNGLLFIFAIRQNLLSADIAICYRRLNVSMFCLYLFTTETNFRTFFLLIVRKMRVW